MKRFQTCLAVILALPLQSLQAAYQNLPVKTREVIFQDGVRHSEVSRPMYSFRVEVISDSDGLKAESTRYGHSFITGRSEERYSVRLYNPLPVRVAANLTVDGLNSLTGKPSGISDGSKWIIEPYSFITIRGWQVSGDQARRFFFTAKPKSYAKWRGDNLGKDLSANCGVIGAAYFWSQKELDAYYEAHAQYRYSQPMTYDERSISGARAESFSPRKSMAKAPYDVAKKQDELQAGTGMGERESNPTQMVRFDYDSGMYRLNQAVIIYYDFAEAPVPNPFPSLSFAPEM